MYEHFLQFANTDMPNKFYPVPREEIEAAEAQMGMRFPSELRQFFQEIGSGFFRQGVKDDEWDHFLINRIVSPLEIAEMVCDKYFPTRPQCGLDAGEMPFFDTGWRDYFLVNALSKNPNQVLWQGGTPMVESIQEFFSRLYEHAGFFADGPGTI